LDVVTGSVGHWLLLGLLVVTGAPLVWRTLVGMAQGDFAADVVASLAIIAAVALGQPIPGLVVVLMQRGGELLEQRAAGRASRAVELLEQSAPRTAHRLGPDGGADVKVDDLVLGDMVVVRPGALVPADGVVESGSSHLDTASLTGEPLPTRVHPGDQVASGSINQESPLTIRITALASESQYARIVALVRSAEASKAPIQRLADRAAEWFTPLTVLVAAVAWLMSGDPLRVLSVLVVATPCPLILATPVAVIGGLNRAARHGILFRDGGAVERIGDVDAVILDKTGTLTDGTPTLLGVVPLALPADDVLALAAAVERGSGHLLARTVVRAAEQRKLPQLTATDVRESAGRGVRGIAGDRDVAVGSLVYVHAEFPHLAQLAGDGAGGVQAHVIVDSVPGGILLWTDQLRPGAAQAVMDLRQLGVARVALRSGDSDENSRAVAARVGITDVAGDQRPEDKARDVARFEAEGHRVLMVGDGTNDAPALATARVGVALAAQGAGISAEAADVVLLRDDIALLPLAIRIGRRTLRIAKQSIGVGLGLSGAAMIAAALGYIPPVAGALYQEAVDVAVILNAVRASRGPRGE
jgi:heavy metal translocating P-type ATPase